MNRWSPIVAALLLPAGLALAGTEDEDTQAPAVSPTPYTAFGVAGIDTSDDHRIARELADEPERVRGTFRWMFPIAGKKWSGGHTANVTSAREGNVRAWTRSTDGKELSLRANADQRPLAFRTRVPFAASELEEAGTHRESVRLTFTAPIPSRSGRVEVFGHWDGGGGLRPSTAAAYAPGDAGPEFLAPAWRTGSHGRAAAGAAIVSAVGPARIGVDGRIADESLDSRFRAPDRLGDAGGLTLSRDERRRAGEAGLSIDVPMGALLAGGSYRFRTAQIEARGGRRQDTPTALAGETTLDDGDLRTMSHRGTLGVTYVPMASVRTSVAATAGSHRARAESSERRELGDETVSRGDTSVDRVHTDLSAEASWRALSWLAVEGRGSLETARIDDEWTQTLLAPGGDAVISFREQIVTRDRAYSKVEGSATAGPWRGVRVTAGATAEQESLDVTVDRAVDSPVFDDRDRERTTFFARVRGRPGTGLTLEARAKAFAETRSLGATDAERRGTEVRGRASYAKDGASVFCVVAVTDDRYELAALPPDAAGLDYLPIEFEGRSVLTTTGVAVPVGKDWRFSANMTRVSHAGDLDARLGDLSIDVGGPLNEKLRLAAGVRRLDWTDERARRQEADALVGFVLLSGAL